MQTISATTSIRAPGSAAFAYAADYRNATKLVPGLTRFDPVSEETSGLGASFEATLVVGPKTYEATLAITTYDQDRQIGWTSTSGSNQSLLWTFEPDGEDGTSVTFDLGYELPGGIGGRILGATVNPILRGRARDTASNLKRQVEAL